MNRVLMVVPERWRWAVAPVGALVIAIALAAGLVPRAEELNRYGLRNWGRSEYSAAIGKLFALRDSVNVYHAAWVLADTRERASREAAASVGLTVRTDADVPPRIAALFGDHARAELTTLTSSPRHPVILRVLMDSSSGTSYRRTITIPATASGPCVVSVRVTALFPDRLRVPERAQLLGACGWYAKFGAPGEGMTKFLTRTSLATAGWHTADVPTTPFKTRDLRNGTAIGQGPFELACAVGRLEVCSAVFDGTESFGLGWMGYNPSQLPPPRRLTNAMRIAVYSDNAFDSQRASRLADMRASLGDDRFAMLWASTVEPAAEFARREGRPLEELVRDNLRGESFRYHRGSAPYGLQLLISLMLIASFAAWAIAKAPREYRV